MTERLKVICWLWSQPGGRAQYAPWHVRIWAAMIRRHLTLPHTLAVVTDMAGDFGPGVEVIAPPRDLEDARIPTWGPGRPQCLRRLAMFRRDAYKIFGADRIVCTDLDLVVCGALDPVLDVAEDFRITRGTATSRAYNGSMMSLRLGSRPQVYETFTIDKAIEAGRRHVGSDQSWIAHCLPGEKTFAPDGVRFWGAHEPIGNARVIFFAGALKPWTLAAIGRERLVTAHYRGDRGDRGDRCLVLGHGPTVWSDLELALSDGATFDAVIASPEVARHWPGPVLAIADDDDHADRLTEMFGFGGAVFCGRSQAPPPAAPAGRAFWPSGPKARARAAPLTHAGATKLEEDAHAAAR